MKPIDLSNVQILNANARTLKLGNTTRLNKQLSQGQNTFATKPMNSTKNFVRLSENSLSAKSKTLITVS